MAKLKPIKKLHLFNFKEPAPEEPELELEPELESEPEPELVASLCFVLEAVEQNCSGKRNWYL